MFQKSVEEFVREKKQRLFEERSKLCVHDDYVELREKNEAEKSTALHQNIDADDKENVPQNSRSSVILQNCENSSKRNNSLSSEFENEAANKPSCETQIQNNVQLPQNSAYFFVESDPNTSSYLENEARDKTSPENQIQESNNPEYTRSKPVNSSRTRRRNLSLETFLLNEIQSSRNMEYVENDETGFYSFGPLTRKDYYLAEQNLLERKDTECSNISNDGIYFEKIQPSDYIITPSCGVIRKDGAAAIKPTRPYDSHKLITHMENLLIEKMSQLSKRTYSFPVDEKISKKISSLSFLTRVLRKVKPEFENRPISSTSGQNVEVRNTESGSVSSNSSDSDTSSSGSFSYNIFQTEPNPQSEMLNRLQQFIVHWETLLTKKEPVDSRKNLLQNSQEKQYIDKNEMASFVDHLWQEKITDLQEKESDNEQEHFSHENEPTMLKYGEFSPNNPKMRVSTQPYLGLGEYEQRRQLLLDQRKQEYQQYAEKVKHAVDHDNTFIRNNFKGSRPVSASRDKAVQTDIQDVNTRLIQCEYGSQLALDKEKSSRGRGVKIDRVQIETQNNIIIPGHSKYLDKVGGVKGNSPRAKLMADLQSSYFPTLMGYTANNTEDEERVEKVRRQEKYLSELRHQIEEKQRLLAKHKEQEKYEQDLATRRLESQLRDINIDNKQILPRHSYTVDVPMNSQDFENSSDVTFNRPTKLAETRLKSRLMDSTLSQHSDLTEKKLTRYISSPPLSRREKKPYSFNIPSNSVFANSLPVKENVDKSGSKLMYNNLTTTKKESQKRIQSNTKVDESLPIPVLKAQSPVAKELINAVAVQSRSSDAMRKLEDKWQIPAVQKNIMKSTERQSEGNNPGILTQLGAIRLQLQQEQLRLDETLRKRGSSQAVVLADVHHNLN